MRPKTSPDSATCARATAAEGIAAVVTHIVAHNRGLIAHRGFADYCDLIDGTRGGGGRFTWTAAMVIEFIS